jgi:hypothetical protein
MDELGQLRELAGLLLLVLHLLAERASEQPHPPGTQRLGMALDELRRLLPPRACVNRTSKHDGARLVDAAHFAHWTGDRVAARPVRFDRLLDAYDTFLEGRGDRDSEGRCYAARRTAELGSITSIRVGDQARKALLGPISRSPTSSARWES